jgi:LacI family transcriptional regulator
MTKRATMNDIALAAGVSQATVSLVLNEVSNARVSPETRARVKALAESMGYAMKGAARVVSSQWIGMLIDDVTSTPFAAPFIEGARAEAGRNGVNVAVVCTGADRATEDAALQMFQAAGALGVLYTSLVTRLVEPPARLAQLPAVLLNCHDRDQVYASVRPGDVLGGFTATSALIAAGHRRLAHLGGENWVEAARDRQLGYRRALASSDIAFDAALISAPAWTVASGRERMLALLDLPKPPTAVFCFNDRVALGAYEAIQSRGLRVPEDISVMGFDDDDLAAQLQPPRSTMVLPHEEMARWAVARLMERGSSPIVPVRVKIDCTPILRSSIAAPRGT